MPEFDVAVVLQNLTYMGIAFVLAVPIAWDRERSERTAGLRTFPLVAIASCGYTLVGIQVLDSTDAEARLFQALMTGMGFIGGGAILKHKSRVYGTATAASLWNTGAIGIAVAFARFEIALMLSVINFAVLRFGTVLKDGVESENPADDD